MRAGLGHKMGDRGHFSRLLLASTALMPLGLVAAAANPLQPNVVGGSATVTGTGTAHVVVKQTTDRAIIDWRTFDIGAGERTQFVQPGATSIALNRVTGGLGPSVIDGRLDANGRVFLINPDGMMFGAGARINTAGFLATTSNITNADFMAGRMNFNIPGRSDASIVNAGRINSHSHGFAALVAPGVRNSGTITATLGTIGLASANAFSLDFYGDRLITLGVGDAIATQVKDVATGQTLDALVKNEGKLKANGGRVELSAVSARTIVDAVINTKGVIEAKSVGTRNGMIVLGGQTAATKGGTGTVQVIRVSGKLDASSKNGKGGTIRVSGEDIRVARAKIDASGKTGGGTVLIGGDVGGGNGNAAVAGISQAQREAWVMPNASNVSVDAKSTIDVSAKDTGNAGKAVVWADGRTAFAGTIKGTGGANGGNGGFAEVSGKERLGFTGAVDLSAAAGKRGTLLLDPQDITIGGSGPWEVSVASLLSALSNGDVTIVTGAGTGNGDITVAQSFSWASGFDSNVLSLIAYRNIVIKDGVTITNTPIPFGTLGGPALRLAAGVDSSGPVWSPKKDGTIVFEGNGKIDFRNSFNTVEIFYNPVGGFINPTNFTGPSGSILVNSSYINPTSQVQSFMWVTNLADLDNIRTNLSGRYAFSFIDASATAQWPGGFTPIGTDSSPFTGVLRGISVLDESLSRGEIKNLTIDAFGVEDVGLFGVIGQGGSVGNVALTNANVTVSGDFDSAGALAGTNLGFLIGASVTGHIANQNPTQSNQSAMGGLVGRLGNSPVAPGQPSPAILLSSSSASVTIDSPVGGYVDAGGLVGVSFGVISSSYANGALNGRSGSSAISYLGGLVGWQIAGNINQSYSVAPITSSTGFTTAGGLVGVAEGTIGQSYAAGRVNVTGDSSTTKVGGLIGLADNTGPGVPLITASYWDKQTTGQATSAGGVGLTTQQLTSALPAGFNSFTWTIQNQPSASYPYLRSSPVSFIPLPVTNPLPHPVVPVIPGPISGGRDVILAALPTTQAQAVQQSTSDVPNQVRALVPEPTPPAQPVILFQQPQPTPANQPGQSGQGGGTQPGQPAGTAAGSTAGPPPPPPPPQLLRPVVGIDGERFSGLPPINETRFITNEVVLQVPLNVSPEEVARVAQQLGLTLLSQQSLDALGRNAYRFQFTGGRTIRDVIRALEQNRIIASAQPNYTYRLSQAPSAEAAPPAGPAPASAEETELAQSTTQSFPRDDRRGDPSQYISSKFGLFDTHRLAGGNGVTVAVIDSQIDRDHSELRGTVAKTFDAVGVPELAHAHGTAMAGAIVSRDRLLGVAPRARILAVRAFSESQTTAEGTTYSILKGIDWAVANGAKIINLSFAGPFDPSLARTLKAAREKGVILIAAAGNAGPKSPPLYPGADPNVIGVTATDTDDKLFRMAVRGGQVAVAAPGVDIIAAAPSAGYQLSTGTSIATAHVSGVVALMLERDPSLTPSDVREILESTATDLGPRGRDAQFGSGLVNPQKALAAVGLRAAARSRAPQ